MGKKLWIRLSAGLVVLVLLAGAGPVLAAVDELTGGYALHHLDLELTGSLEPKIERRYHSFSQESSIFGPGWFSPYELRLRHEGKTLRLFDACRGADRIYRRAPSPTGETLYRSALCGCDTIRVSEKGFLREGSNGQVEHFDGSGRLIRITDRHGHWLQLERDLHGRLTAVNDEAGRSIRITLDSNGRATRIVGGGHSADYAYDSAGLLLRAQTDAGEMLYRYDADGLLTARHPAGEEGETIAYADAALRGTVAGITAEDGIRTLYTFRHDDGDLSRRLTTVQELDAEGDIISQRRLDFELYPEATDELLIRRKSTWVDGETSLREYNEAGLLLLVEREGQRTRFTYDTDNRLIRKDSADGVVTELSYDSASGKIDHVRSTEAGDDDSSQEVSYAYNLQNDVVQIVHSDGRSITLDYDNRGRIVTIDDTEHHLSFTYNHLSKPQTIALRGSQDPIQVVYAEDGEVTKVDGGEGQSVALAVTATFQNLLDLIRLAQVDIED